MNVTELKSQLDQALSRGLHPDTEVVLAIPETGWYVLLEDEVEHPVDGREGADMWFTLSPRWEGDSYVDADSRFTPCHEAVPDPVLYAEYGQAKAEDPEGTPGYYTDWLRERYEGLAGALRDDPPRSRSELAGDYRGLSALLGELERMDPS